ncbi:MAG: hydroxymethylglutaryl-CoA reductase, degradative [Anaerolineales bacterium]|nr:hydroxymethylglutaryl-CoA reductase, degradative [Anaerolineales bacterium]
MTPKQTSKLPGFYNLQIQDRLERLLSVSGLSAESIQIFSGVDGLTISQADHMIENAIGIFGLPLGIATNFLINEREVLIPMAIEEPSVVAGASFMAKLVREGGGFHAEASDSEMIGQIQILDVEDPEDAIEKLSANRDKILDVARMADPVLVDLGGGPRDIEVRILRDTPVGPIIVLHLIMDTLDAMGANAVNTAVEALSPLVEQLTGGRVHLRILSNLADRRLARASCRVPLEALGFGDYSGEQVRDGVIEAWAFATVDPYRAATHNKGIMNGVDAVVIATGNDWRAVEAGAHAYAARSGTYTSLSQWGTADDGTLTGELEMPLAIGTVGGATRVNPTAKACLDLMGIESARELAEITVSVGLAQNLAALRALATEGIQRGHMSLHARQIAIAAGAEGDVIDIVAQRMVSDGIIRIDYAEKILQGKT